MRLTACPLRPPPSQHPVSQALFLVCPCFSLAVRSSCASAAAPLWFLVWSYVCPPCPHGHFLGRSSCVLSSPYVSSVVVARVARARFSCRVPMVGPSSLRSFAGRTRRVVHQTHRDSGSGVTPVCG